MTKLIVAFAIFQTCLQIKGTGKAYSVTNHKRMMEEVMQGR
jgi:hypothetical protein